jgi:orotidine-5'-phosphate decarboxylase
VIALTVVTSVTEADLAAVGVAGGIDAQVLRLAALAVQTGCDGVVASAREVSMLRAALGPEPLIVTPGVQVGGAAQSEHARAASATQAVAAGATHLVLGRSITRASDPAAVLARLRADLTVSQA